MYLVYDVLYRSKICHIHIGCTIKVAKRNVMSNIGRHMMSYCRIYIAMARIRQNIKCYQKQTVLHFEKHTS